MDWDRLLEGQVALITGSGSGQGRAAAVLFAEHGARVAVVDMNGDGARETVKAIETRGGEAFSIEADVSQRPATEDMIEQTVERYGALDILYNNAAVQMSGRLVECTEDQWDLTLRTNLTCIFWACRAALPHLRQGAGGRIISTASTLALMGSPGYAAYGAAKAGLIALTRQIASEYGPEVRANVIAPGSIDTPRFRKVADRLEDTQGYLDRLVAHNPMRRLGLAEDVASTALFLASDASAYVTGVTIPVDGGMGYAR
jgi:NAD(P)-dependent dehydrogenase (short-subunit alcohol dehydrogenase family)